MSNETLIGTLIVLTVLILATCVPLLVRALQRARVESLAPAPDFAPIEPVIEAPSTDPERLGFEEAVARMLARYPVSMLDRSRLAGEIEHHWQQHLAGIATWASAFAAVEAWVRRHTQIERPLTQRQIQTLRDPRQVAGSARRLAGPRPSVVIDETMHIAMRDHVEGADPGETNPEAESDRVAIAGVRDLIEGRITQPLPGTLAARVQDFAYRRNPALAGVMDLIEGRNPDPLPGTVAWRVEEWAKASVGPLFDRLQTTLAELERLHDAGRIDAALAAAKEARARIEGIQMTDALHDITERLIPTDKAA